MFLARPQKLQEGDATHQQQVVLEEQNRKEYTSRCESAKNAEENGVESIDVLDLQAVDPRIRKGKNSKKCGAVTSDESEFGLVVTHSSACASHRPTNPSSHGEVKEIAVLLVAAGSVIPACRGAIGGGRSAVCKLLSPHPSERMSRDRAGHTVGQKHAALRPM